MRLARLLPLFVVLLIVSCFSAQAQQPAVLTHEDQQTVHIQPARPASSVALASSALRSAVERLERGQALGPAIDVVDSKIRVEVLHDLKSSEIRAVITDLGGTVEGEVEGVLVQALVPFDRLVALESHDGVQFVRPPLEANVPILPPSDGVATPQNGSPIVGEEVAKTNANAWHGAGYTGAGVKVGIVDYFDDTLWSYAQAAGELPTPAGTFCQCEGTSYDIWAVGGEHGQAVAEIIHEMAPSAQLYLATVCTVSDLQDAVDYFDSQGVDIISRSLTAQYDGPGDGTGPIATVIDNAVADGIVWFNSAGNSASDGVYYGTYWRGQWADANTNGWLDYQPGVELMPIWCPYTNGVRWSDFGAADPYPTDYNVCVYDQLDDTPGITTPIGCSYDDQTTGAPPLELNIPCRSEWDYLAIHLWDAGNGTSGDVLEFMTNGGAVYYWQNPHSASGPASDTASPGGLSVGAVDPPLGTAIAYYSSQGPTNDELYGGTDRMKPDISAAAGVSSYTYGTFSGTSASTPAAAGAAALIIEAGLASTPAEVKAYLLSNATVDRGAPGPDNVFGEGELFLGSPPPPDSDGDTVPDEADNCPATYDTGNGDNDGDGIPGTQPPPGATWGGDACDADDDNDHMSDDYEVANFCLDSLVGDAGVDPDGDGLTNFGEMVLGTDPCSYDASLANHSDGDGSSDGMEQFLGTDPLDDCPDIVGTPGLCPGPSCDGDDAWPFDLDVNREVDIIDVLFFKPVFQTEPDDPSVNRRFDLYADGGIDILDVLSYKPVLMTQCTNP